MSKILILFLILTVSSYSQEDGLVNWANGKIKWSYFKGEIDSNSQKTAMTLVYVSTHVVKKRGTKMVVGVKNRFKKNTSWTKSDTGFHLLNHEQKHFDIEEIFARKYRKEISNKTFLKVDLYNNFVQHVFDSLSNQAALLHKMYDSSTNHSLNKKEQLKWNEKIDKMLEELEEYRKETIVVYIEELIYIKDYDNSKRR